MLLGLGRGEEEWVFDRGDGKPWEPGAFSLRFARLAKAGEDPHSFPRPTAFLRYSHSHKRCRS